MQIFYIRLWRIYLNYFIILNIKYPDDHPV